MQSKINLVLISCDAKFVLVSFKEQQRWDDDDGGGGSDDGDDDNWHRHKNYHDEHTQMYENAIDRAHTFTFHAISATFSINNPREHMSFPSLPLPPNIAWMLCWASDFCRRRFITTKTATTKIMHTIVISFGKCPINAILFLYAGSIGSMNLSPLLCLPLMNVYGVCLCVCHLLDSIISGFFSAKHLWSAFFVLFENKTEFWNGKIKT